MKKILAAAFISVFFFSCVDAKRTNPTDPQASNYIGIHYNGKFGQFTALADLVADGGLIYCIDQAGTLYDYSPGGDEKWSMPGIDRPTGICKIGNNIYIAQDVAGAPDIEVFDISDTENISPIYKSLTFDPGKITTDGTNIYVTAPSEEKIYVFSVAAVNIPGSISPVFSTGTAGTLDWQLQGISDIEMHGADIAVADNAANKIIFMKNNGVFLKSINIGQAIKGFNVINDVIYVPTAAGVHEYAYDTGNLIKTWGDYGEGNGKVSRPSLIEWSGSSIFVEDGTDVKVFEP